MFHGKKGHFGAYLLVGLILFNIFIYILVRTAAASGYIDTDIGEYGTDYGDTDFNATTSEDIDSADITWRTGFNVGLFFGDSAWFYNLFYYTFQTVLFGMAIYLMIRLG